MPESSPQLHLPLLFFPLLAALGALLFETWTKRRASWAVPAAVVYVTIIGWYFVDLIITPEEYVAIPDSVMTISYAQVAIFLIAYRVMAPLLTRKIVKNALKPLRRVKPTDPRHIFLMTVVFWAFLLGCGVWRMDGDLLGTLLPLDARTGANMWGRAGAGDAGATGFLVSTGGYLYALVCASFGVWPLFLKKRSDQFLALGMVLVVWPYFLLGGTRNAFLAVALPCLFAFMLFGRQRLWVRVTCIVVALLALDVTLRVMLTYRNIGFRSLLTVEVSEDAPETLEHHKGLNMIQELCYVNIYSMTQGPAYGTRYLQELISVIPRALWPTKPMLGIDYAVWRGFGGGDRDIGVVATISSGMVGGGVLNFGRVLGPLAPAFLMAVWTAVLARWWVQRASVLRALLFLVGMGLTFNLGRDITLLVLWPVVFGYFIVRLVEFLRPRRWTPRLAKTDRRRNTVSVQPVETPALGPSPGPLGSLPTPRVP